MMKKLISLLLGMLLIFIVSGSASATPVQFAGNGHWYEVMTTNEWELLGFSGTETFYNKWSRANQYSDDYSYLGEVSYFVTITSADENAFVAGLVSQVGLDAWLGGTDQNVEGTWKWAATGELFSYTNWAAGEPNNLNNEDYLEMYASNGKWNDLDRRDKLCAYVIEYDGVPPSAVPEPATMMLFGLGLLGLAGVSRKRK